MLRNFQTLVFAFVLMLMLFSNALFGQQSPENPLNDSHVAFQTLNSHTGNTVRADPHVGWSRYVVYRLPPSAYQPTNPRHSLTPRQVEKIEATVDASLRKDLRQDAERAGPVLEVRPVITDVKKVIPLINLVSFLAVQAPFSYGGASVRYELFDAETGMQIGEIDSRRSARPWNVYPWDFLQNFQKLGHSSLIVKRDACMVRKDLNRLAALKTDANQELVAKAQ